METMKVFQVKSNISGDTYTAGIKFSKSHQFNDMNTVNLSPQ